MTAARGALPAIATALAPLVFVAMWSTGHIGTRLGIPYAEPFTFLGWRLLGATALMIAIAVATGAPWPRRPRDAAHIVVAGLLIHGIYLGGVFSAIALGMTTGVLAVITGLQPLLVAAAVGPWLGERVTVRQWAGLVLGFAGVTLVLWEKMSFGGLGVAGVVAAVACLISISAGTLYQKRFCPDLDLRSGTAIQLAASALSIAVLARVFETRAVATSAEFLFAVGWLILVLSVGAYNLLYYLLRRGAAAKVSSLFYLTPPTTAVMGYALFGEVLGATALAGMAVAVLGVALASR